MPAYKEPAGLAEQIAQLRTRWPQAHYEPPTSGNPGDEHLIILPGTKLPKGWNKTICTVLFLARPYRDFGTASPLNGFYVDLPDLRLAENMALPHYSRRQEYLTGFRQWRDLTRFWWRAQMHDPSRDTLYTAAMQIRQRLNPAR